MFCSLLSSFLLLFLIFLVVLVAVVAGGGCRFVHSKKMYFSHAFGEWSMGMGVRLIIVLGFSFLFVQLCTKLSGYTFSLIRLTLIYKSCLKEKG